MLKDFDTVREYWGDEVAYEILIADKYPMTFEQFLSQHCYATGGNWGKMLLTGIEKLWPRVYDAIPEYMGSNCFETIVFTLYCLGIWVPEDA